MSESNRDPARVEEERLVFEELKSRAVPYAFGWVQIRYDGELILFSEKAGADSFLGATDVFEAWPWSDAGFLLLRPAPVPGGAAGAAALVCGVGSLRPFSDLLSSWKARLAQTRRAGGLSSESVPSDALRTIREYLGRISRGLTRLAQVLLAGLEDRRGSDARPDRLPLALPLRALLVSWPGLAAAPEPLSPLRGGAGFRLRCLSALPTLGAKEQVSVPGAFRVRDTPRNLLEADRYLQYLLGLVLYEAVSTLSPVEFREEDGSVPVPVSFVVPEVNAVPAFGAWLMKLLAASPDHRFYSLEVAGRVLRSLFGEEAPPPARRYDLFVGLHEGMQKGAEHAREGKPVIQEDSLAVVNSLPSSEGGEERAEN